MVKLSFDEHEGWSRMNFRGIGHWLFYLVFYTIKAI